jgi:hypothetical protein
MILAFLPLSKYNSIKSLARWRASMLLREKWYFIGKATIWKR